MDSNRDLNFSLPKYPALADFGVHNPLNAWPGASTDIRIMGRWTEDGVVIQEGWNVGEERDVWMRWRSIDGVWSTWTKLAPETSGAIGAAAYFADGAEEIALPAYTKLAFTSAMGKAATIENGDLRINPGGQSVVEARVYVTNAFGNHVVFGSAWDGAAPAELGRVLITSREPVLVLHRMSLPLTPGGLLSLYISSDVEEETFTWSDGEILLLVA